MRLTTPLYRGTRPILKGGLTGSDPKGRCRACTSIGGRRAELRHSVSVSTAGSAGRSIYAQRQPDFFQRFNGTAVRREFASAEQSTPGSSS